MCVIFFYINSNPGAGGYKLILASNRDEFYARMTQSAIKWTKKTTANADYQHYNVYGGIDLEPGREGGTWLAIGANKNVIKVAALLNLTGEPTPRNSIVQNNSNDCLIQQQKQQQQQQQQQRQQSKMQHYHLNSFNIININNCIQNKTHTHNNIIENSKKTTTTTTTNGSLSLKQQQKQQQQQHHNNNFLLGRGMIVTDFVSSSAEMTIDDYNKHLEKDCTKYNAFNFVSIEIRDKLKGRVMLCSNVPPAINNYEEGKCYGFGNSLPDQPFQKVYFGTENFQKIVANFQQNQLQQQGLNLDQKSHLIAELLNLLKCKHKYWPDAELARRAPNWGEYLSAINVSIPFSDYGSRTHTIILIDANNHMTFIEETMNGLNPDAEWHKTVIEKQLFDEDIKED